jgi:polar amino acid transport system permease protein
MQTFLRDATQFLPLLLQGVKFTIIVALGSLALSTALGLVWALMRVSGIGWLATTAKIVVNTLRGIPILVQLFYIYFVLPEFGIALSALQAAIIGIGMGWGLTMRRVILPQAIRLVLPPYGNIMVMMLKDSSQASTITVAELTLQGTLIASSTFKNMTVYTLVALLYLAMCLPLMGLVSWLERRFGKGARR